MKGERESFMDIDAVLNYFATYGLTLLFVIVFLEYLNLPGLPAGIIMPAAGILASRNSSCGFYISCGWSFRKYSTIFNRILWRGNTLR